ncbi:MAG: RNA polymerase sigma factor [Candidatus Marinimicrobia bacterium]|nr:RNA polymerase sigma factor [Candidatus Neomarinimicrobiota bacterium]
MDEKIRQLIFLAQDGNTEMFHELVALHDKRIMILAYQLTQNTQDAEDLCQDVFLKVYRNIKSYKFKSDFYTWIYRITVNTALNQKRKSSLLPITDIHEYENDPHMGWVSDVGDSPVIDIAPDIAIAVNRLPPKQKTVFVLKHFQGQKIREIAVILGCSEGTIKRYLFRAMEKLRTSLKDVYYD